MKQLFLGAFFLFALMYVGAEATLEREKNDGITHLRWATDDNPARKVQVSAFHTLFPRERVTVDPGLGGDQTKLIVQCATGTGPDIIDLGSEGQMQTLVEAGVLLDLTPYAQQMGFDPGRTYPALAPALAFDGKQYRFPCNVWANCVIYNRRIFDDHGVPYPKPGWTYDEFVATAKAIREKPSKSGQTHIPIANWLNTWLYEDMLIGFGGRLFSPDGLHSQLAAPESVSALNLYRDMMWKDHIIPTAAESSAMSGQGGWGSQGINWFSDGRAAMIVIGRWYIVQVPNFPNLKGNLGAALLPHLPGKPSCGMTDARAAGINVKSPHWREALNFLKYLAGPEYGQVIVHDGDSLPPSPSLACQGKDLANEAVPDPAFHQPFIDAVKRARPLDNSPFIDPGEVDRWIKEAVDKVENRIQTPEEALRQLAGQIDAQIRVNLERRPDLQRRAHAPLFAAHSQARVP